MPTKQWMTMENEGMPGSNSILKCTKQGFLPSLTKVICTLGPSTHSVEALEECLTKGMSVARFAISWLDTEYHLEALSNLQKAAENVNKLCGIMLDTAGPELQVRNKTGDPILLKMDDKVTLTADLSKSPSATIIPISYSELSKVVKTGDTIFLGQYLFTGCETTSVWLEVVEKNGQDVICLIKNTATLTGYIFTMHVSQAHINIPTLTDTDKQVISKWGSHNDIDIISLSYTRSASDVHELRVFLASVKLSETRIFAKIENTEGLDHFDEILEASDGIIFSRGNLGVDLPPEKVFSSQKTAVDKCNMAGKPAIITRVVDSMIDNLRPTRAEATDVANAVLDGTDSILLGAETHRGPYPVQAIQMVGNICNSAEQVYNYSLQFKRIGKYAGESASHLESVASSAVRAATEVKASIIVVLTSSGRAARLIAKYRPQMPILALFIPKENSNFSIMTQARQCLAVRGIYPVLGSLSNVPSADSNRDDWLKFALNHAEKVGLISHNDRVIVFEKIKDHSIFKIHDFITQKQA
ncbi:Pyruvate kinase [Zostera marina]|uniref:Pyruvate kinase n=1 Tax=Zostera marina TaxID=29655 RepID=A0A0K9PWL4_ZOSMR|nr:Pyruvate kinase [Zostera marina]